MSVCSSQPFLCRPFFSITHRKTDTQITHTRAVEHPTSLGTITTDITIFTLLEQIVSPGLVPLESTNHKLQALGDVNSLLASKHFNSCPMVLQRVTLFLDLERNRSPCQYQLLHDLHEHYFKGHSVVVLFHD